MQKFLPLLFLALTACSKPSTNVATEHPTYSVDATRVSISGLSSGGYMAGQVHLSHSALFNGIAIVGGGPYYCAKGSLSRGLGPCIKGGELELDSLTSYARAAATAGKLDDLGNLADDHVWIFHGALDTVIDQGASLAAAAQYTDLISQDAVTLVTEVAAVHGFPTLHTGSPCATFAAPFLNACEYDTAGEILRALHGDLNARTSAGGQLLTIKQPGFKNAGMLEQAYLYVPTTCGQGARCGMHVAIHGCSQSTEFVGDAFVAGAGFNEWAEANNLLVLYPQVASSKIAPLNPYGCWDWWGYTGTEYATKEGPQVMAIKATVDALAGRVL